MYFTPQTLARIPDDARHNLNVLRRLYRNRWVRYALTVILLGLIVLKVEPSRLSSAAASARPAYLALALVLTVPFLCLKALRWRAMLDNASVHTTLGEAFLSLMGGMGLALLTPARLGELVRAAYIRDPQKVRIGGLVMIDKGFDVLVLAGLSVAGAWAILGPGIGGLLAVATILGLIAVYNPRPLHRALATVLPSHSFVHRLLGSIDALTPGPTTVYLLLTLASFAIVLLQFGLVLLSWRAWSFQVVLFTFPLVILTNILPVTIGGLGVREGVAVVLLAHFGVPAAEAALAAFLMFAINTALPGVVGGILLPAVSANGPAQPVQRADPP